MSASDQEPGKKETTSTRNDDKAAYSPPRLKTFGSVGSLTQAGTKGGREGSMAKNPNMA